MSEDLEQLGALFCAFFIVFAYEFLHWVYQITSFVIFYLIDTLRLSVIRFKNVWNLHIFVVASAAFFITWFVLKLNSPELELEENADDNFPLLQQVSENSLLFGDLNNNEGNNDTDQNENSVEDVSVNKSVSDNEMDCPDLDADVQSQHTSVKGSDCNGYVDCNENVQLSTAADGKERQDIHEVCSDNAARSTVQTSIGGVGVGADRSHTHGIHNNSDQADVVSLHEAQVSKDKDDIKGGCIASEIDVNNVQSKSNVPSGVHGNNDSQDDIAAEDDKISSSPVSGVISADNNNNQDDLTDKEVDMINTSSSFVTGGNSNNDAQDFVTDKGVGKSNTSSKSLVTGVHGNNDAQDEATDKEVGKSNTSSKDVVTGVHGNNDAQDFVTDKGVGKSNTSSKGMVTVVHGNNDAQDVVTDKKFGKVITSSKASVTSVCDDNSAVDTDREDYTKSNSSSKQDGLCVHGDKDDLSDFIAPLHRDPVISIEVNDIDPTSSDDELTLCSSTCTLVSETADRLADLLSSSSCSSITSHDSMGDAADHEDRVDELDLKYWGKLLASIAERLSIKSLRYGKVRILYKDPNGDKPAVDVTPWGVALVHGAKEYIETGFLARRMVLPPCDTMYDQVEKHLLNNVTLDIKIEQDADGQLDQSSVDTEWAMEIPQGSQIIIGAGFTAGLCFLCWRLFKA